MKQTIKIIKIKPTNVGSNMLQLISAQSLQEILFSLFINNEQINTLPHLKI